MRLTLTALTAKRLAQNRHFVKFSYVLRLVSRPLCSSSLIPFSQSLDNLNSTPLPFPRMVISRGLKQAYDVQNFAHEALMALREQLTQDGKVCAPDPKTASTLVGLGKVWKDAQEQVRIHRGKPLPGSLTHEKVTRARGGRARASLSALASAAAAPLPEQPHDHAEQPQQPQPPQPVPGGFACE